jgi:hypothetical protein
VRRRIVEPDREEMKGGWRNVHNDEVQEIVTLHQLLQV